MATASKKEILQELESIDLNELLDRMEDYVRTRFYSRSERDREGFDYLDFCYNVLMKACTGTRNWDKEKTSFENFIFGALKSDLYNFFRSQKNKKEQDNGDQTSTQEVYLIELNDFVDLEEIQSQDTNQDIDFETISENSLNYLKHQGADEVEIGIFECWLAGYEKPQEIAELCGITTAEVNNAVKRLSRKTIKLKEQWKNLRE